MKEELFKKIKALPPLPDTVIKIQGVCINPDASLHDLTTVVEKDPMITANILKATNSPLYGFSREINNISQAVSLFGMSTVKGFAMSTAVAQTFPINLAPYGLNAAQFASIAQKQNALAFHWLKNCDKKIADTLMTASFLLETGALIIADYINKNDQTTDFKQAVASKKDLQVIEEAFTGTTKEEVAAEMFKQWNFDQILSDSIRFSNDAKKADDKLFPYAAPLAVIKKAITLTQQLTPETIAAAIALATDYNLDVKSLQEAIDTVSA
jgi:HD-like signal output (HDOD) protein